MVDTQTQFVNEMQRKCLPKDRALNSFVLPRNQHYFPVTAAGTRPFHCRVVATIQSISSWMPCKHHFVIVQAASTAPLAEPFIKQLFSNFLFVFLLPNK